MKCVICRHGQCQPGTVDITRRIGGTTLVLRDVPASICDNCGEEYLNSDTAEAVYTLTQKHRDSGAEVVITAFGAAA
jgi:YgiT-type zinc finger domain-containing protein